MGMLLSFSISRSSVLLILLVYVCLFTSVYTASKKDSSKSSTNNNQDQPIDQKAAPTTNSRSNDNSNSHLKSAISKTYLINLDQRRDRLSYISKRLYDLQIPYEKFSGISFHHGQYPITEYVMRTRLHPQTKMNLTVVRDDLNNGADTRRNWGSTGCWQSHLQVFFDIYNGSASFLPGPFLILEDDVELSDKLPYFLSEYFLNEVMPDDWEMLFLSTLQLECHNTKTSKSKNSFRPFGNSKYTLVSDKYSYDHQKVKEIYNPKELCHIAFTYLSSGYLLRDQAAVLKLLNLVNTAEVAVIDRIWNPLFQRKQITAYAIKRNPVWQRNTVSNILEEKGHKSSS